VNSNSHSSRVRRRAKQERYRARLDSRSAPPLAASTKGADRDGRTESG